MTPRILFFIVLVSLCAQAAWAQTARFSDHYPLAVPKSLPEQKADFEKTLTAIAGGIIMMEDAPSSKEDPEAMTKEDYALAIDEMVNYGVELALALENTTENDLKKVPKLVRSGKYEDATGTLKDCGAKEIGQGSEQVFFIWRTYLLDKKNNAPWLMPENIDVARKHRAILNYVAKNYDRPFGAHAETGAVAADAAQALSNSLENPQALTWKGEGELTFKQADELRRLASNVAYFEWRLHDPTNAQRSKAINLTIFQHIQLAMFDMVRSLMSDKAQWSKDPAHGSNLLQLYNDVKNNGWTVDGERALKEGNNSSNNNNSSSNDSNNKTSNKKTPKEKPVKEEKPAKEKTEKEPKAKPEKEEKEPKEKKEKDEDEE